MSSPQQASHYVHFGQAMLPQGWARDVRIGIADGLIVALETDAAASPGDARHAIGLPGMPNLHSHAFQRAMAGLAERRGPGADSFWTWREAMYRFVDRIGPDALRAIAAQAYMEMLESGFTRVGEFHYLHHDPAGMPYADPAEMTYAIVAAAEESGIALTHLPVFYAHSGFGGAAPSHGQRRFVHDLDGFARLYAEIEPVVRRLDDAVVGIAPHSLRAVTARELAHLSQIGAGGPIHIHIGEQVREVEDCLAWCGRRPVEWLLENAPVDRAWCLVHATHMTPVESRALAASGAVAGLCPVTEANLGDGLFALSAFREVGGRLGIGSDSNVLIDMSEELRWLEYGQRLASQSRNVMASAPGRSTGQGLFVAALEGGAQALGVDAHLAIGNPADMLSLDPAHPSLVARADEAALDSFLFAAGRAAIDCVWRRGRIVVQGGRHLAREAIADRYRKTMATLLA